MIEEKGLSFLLIELSQIDIAFGNGKIVSSIFLFFLTFSNSIHEECVKIGKKRC